jgi:maltooligosyltrehalose synthase
VVAFVRRHQQAAALIAVPRLSFTLMNGEARRAKAEDWGTTRLHLPEESREFRNVLTGERVVAQPNGELLCREVFASFPVALLVE